jgi:hypothetical protein
VESPLAREGSRYRKNAERPSQVFSWARQYVNDIHRPETWAYVQFEQTARPFVADASWAARRWLTSVYYGQREYQRAHRRFASSLNELGMVLPTGDGLRSGRLGSALERWQSCVSKGSEEWCIREDSRLWKRR